MKKTIVVLLFVLASCASANNNDVQPGDAEHAIAAQNEMFMRAVRAKNVDDLANFYSDSVVLMPEGEPAKMGRDAVLAFWRTFLAGQEVELRLRTANVMQSGDLAVERGEYDIEINSPPRADNKGGRFVGTGKYIVVWRKLNGKWRATEDIFNSNAR